MEHVQGELHTLWIVGSTETVELTMAIRFAMLYAEALSTFRRRGGPRSPCRWRNCKRRPRS
jgi:hypothetical protein